MLGSGWQFGLSLTEDILIHDSCASLRQTKPGRERREGLRGVICIFYTRASESLCVAHPSLFVVMVSRPVIRGLMNEAS